MRIRKLFLPLAIVTCICAVFFVYYKIVRAEVERDTQLYIQEILQQSRQGVQRSVADVFHTLETVALAFETIYSEKEATAMRFMESVALQNQFKRMGIIFPDGRVLTTDKAKLKALDREYVQKAFAGQTNLSSSLEERVGAAKGSRINVYATPLRKNGKVTAVIFATYDTDFLGAMLSTSMFDGQGFSYIIRKDGSLVAAQRYAALSHYANMLQAFAPGESTKEMQGMVQDLADGKSGIINFVVDGTRYQALYAPVGEDDLYVLSVVPERIFAEESSRRMALTLSLMLALFILTIALLVNIWHVNKRVERETMRAREEAAASKAKSDFLSTMSHEIRTPLNAIVGFIHLLGQSPMDGPQKEYLRKVRISADALLQIINDILDFSKIEAGRMELEAAPFALESLLDAVISIVFDSASVKGLALTVDVEEGTPPVLMGDRTRLAQVLLNLLNNAIKFTHEGSVRVHVRLDPPGATPQQGMATLFFSVEDTGIGLTTEQAGRLFRPFSQADSSTTRRYGGTGLGLTICRQLVRLMEGEIGVTSLLNKGTTFYFTVRLGIADSAELFALAAPAQDEDAPLWVGKRILVAEDNEINQEIVTEVLNGFGLYVDIAGNGEEAVTRVAEGTYDLIFMDMQMPGMDGLEGTRRIRALGKEPGYEWLRDVPVVAFTANAMMEDRQRCLDAGMNDYLSKPIDFKAMKQCLIKWLGHS